MHVTALQYSIHYTYKYIGILLLYNRYSHTEILTGARIGHIAHLLWGLALQIL